MNHKRKGPKSTRAGCLLCHPTKRQGVIAPTRQEQRADDSQAEQEGALEWTAGGSLQFDVLLDDLDLVEI